MRKLFIYFALFAGLTSQALAADNYGATAGAGLIFGAKDAAGVLYSRFIGCDNTTVSRCWVVDASGNLGVNVANSNANGQAAMAASSPIVIASDQSPLPVANFTPNGNFTTLTATAASSASTALPAGIVVSFQNTSNDDVSCVLSAGAATATTSKLIVHGGSTTYFTVGSNVNTACINQSSSASNVIALAGGTGHGTSFGSFDAQNLSASVTQSGTWTVQPGNTANTTPWLVTPSAGTTGGCTPAKTLSAATTNSTSIKGSVGTLCKMITINTTATLYYLKMYNTAAAPTCNSDTVVATYPVPPSNGGVAVNIGPFGEAYTNGIGFCLTANLADNDNTAAATGVTISYSSK
jgi:hypothetical protein